MKHSHAVAKLWVAHLALVEAEHHEGRERYTNHPLGITHHEIPRSSTESVRLLRVARQATWDALEKYPTSAHQKVRDAADRAWWR